MARTSLSGKIVTGAVTDSPFALTDGATISVDASKSNDLRVTLGGNRTMGAPSNPTDGQRIIFHLTQDGTGTRTVTWNSAYSFGSGTAPTLSTAAASLDLVAFVYNTTKTKWLFAGFSGGF